MNRRRFLVSAASLLATAASPAAAQQLASLDLVSPNYQNVVVNDRPSAAAAGRIPRETVAYAGAERPGTVIVNTAERRLYLVLENGQALRYGIGVGREGFAWTGSEPITRMAEWPSWTPPAEMIQRRPDLPRFMPGGPANPLGARALYLGSSLYRIHGSNEPATIGQAVSSGCIRMLNDDVVDLYARVRVGTRVVVL